LNVTDRQTPEFKLRATTRFLLLRSLIPGHDLLQLNRHPFQRLHERED